MNAEQKQRMAHELGQWNAAMKSACSVANLLAISTRMAALLQEIANAPEPEPVVYQVRNGWVNIALYERQIDAENYAKDQQKRHDLSGSLAHFCVVPLYTAPPVNNQSEQHLEMVNPPAPSVPDGLNDLTLSNMRKKLGLPEHCAERKILCAIDELLATRPPEQPTDLVRDAERYRWLRNWTRGAYGIDSNPAFILPHVPIPTVPDQNIMCGSLAQHLDNAIDAAIERDKLKGGAA